MEFSEAVQYEDLANHVLVKSNSDFEFYWKELGENWGLVAEPEYESFDYRATLDSAGTTLTLTDNSGQHGSLIGSVTWYGGGLGN